MAQRWVTQRLPWPEEPQAVSVTSDRDGRLRVQLGDATLELEVAQENAEGRVLWNGRSLPFAVAHQGERVYVWLDGESYVFTVQEGRPRGRATGHGAGGPAAQVPGKVVQVLVQEGDAVEAGQRLVVIESMKMEFVVRAAGKGTVRKVLVALGAQVTAGQPVVQVEV